MNGLKKHYTRRLTCIGVQYTTPGHTITVDAENVQCSCGLICEHVAAVEAHELAYQVEAVQRSAYTATFDIY